MQSENNNFFSSFTGIVIIVLLVLCCCCLIVLAGGLGGALYLSAQSTPVNIETTPFEFNFDNYTPTPVIPVEITRVPVEDIPTETLKTLEENIVPINDPPDLACRLQGICNVPETLPSGPFNVGENKSFWLVNSDSAESFEINARLEMVTPHAYLWVQDGVKINKSDAKDLMDAFESKMYPTNREFFGSEWTPGIDEDPHIYIVYGRGIGESTAGYFSSADSYHPDVKKYSNAHEMFVFNADNSPLNDTYTYSVLAHEFQHMIHWKQDRNETSWINEGFSELAVLLNGYTVGGKDYEYISEPDLQLTDWGTAGTGSNGPHYGASFLFTTYFLDRFGEEATKALVKDTQNGMESVNNVLQSFNATDPLSGQPISANDLFMDWAVTNYLLDGSVGDGRYVYSNYSEAMQASDTETIYDCPSELRGTVNQYGVDYIRFNCGGTRTIIFEGATQTGLLPMNAYSGKMAFWSNKGDESDMSLSREFDFSSTTGPITLSYRTWYDIEKDYDYVYLEASDDGGQTWEIIQTPSSTDTNPSGNSYGWGYTDKTNGWILETVDLSQFAGKKVTLRFEYVTDAAVNGEGLMLDDISISEIGYFSDLETDDGGWQGNGFVRIENILPQTFRLALINRNGSTTVETISVNPDQTAEITVDLTDITLVVSGTTPFTREDGHYSITVK